MIGNQISSQEFDVLDAVEEEEPIKVNKFLQPFIQEISARCY